MEEMDRQLPYRLKQKDDTKKHFFLSKKLKTLYKIIAERESVILKEKRNNLVIETQKQLSSKQNHKEFLRKIYNNKVEVKAHNGRVKQMSNLMENLTVDEEPLLQDLTKYISFIPFENVYHRYEDLEQSLDEVTMKIESLVLPYMDSLEECFNFASISSINRIKRQLILTKNLPSHQIIVQQIHKKYTDITNEREELMVSLEEISKELEKEKTLNIKHRKDHHLPTNEIVGNVFKFHHDSYDLQKKIFSATYEIFRCVKEITANEELIFRCEATANIDPRLVKTLFDIECFIHDPITGSAFKDDYYGPLFTYLTPKDLIERDLWHELLPLMSVFMFGKVSTARAFHLALQKSGKQIEGYTLMGMDDFYTRPYQAIPHDLKEKVNPASDIVKINIRFQHILFRLLDGTIRVNDKSLNIEQLFRSKVAVVSEDNLSIGYWNSLVSVGWTPDVLIGTRDSPLDHLHMVYRCIDKYKKETFTLKRVKSEVEIMRNKLQKLHCYEHRLGYVILHRTKDRFHMLMEKELKIKEDLIRTMEEMKCFENLKKELNSVDDWNLDELTTSCLHIDLSKMHQKNKKKCEIDEEFGKLRDIDRSISINNDEMEHWMFNTLDHWNQWNAETLADHKNYLEQCQELIIDFYNILFANLFQEMSNWNYKYLSSQDDEHGAKVKFIEIKGLIQKLYFDLKFVENELEASKKIIRDAEATDMTTYTTYKERELKYVLQAIEEIQKELKNSPEPLSREQYVDLRETIQDVINFSNTPKHNVVAQNSVTPKAFPYCNRYIVNMLKDTVISYELSYKYIMSKFIRKCTLYCYEQNANDPAALTKEDFNWQFFDLTRFKSIDFKTIWANNGREIVGDEVHTTIKAFILIIHLIRYVSHFKFIMVHEHLFAGMDSRLVEKVEKVLEMMSEYVQVMIITN
ncbi:unnamed protein product [Diamesa serratosioi]